MKVLLITFSFPPAGGVGVLRALSLAKYLPAEDIELHVLTARNAPAVGRDPSSLTQVPAGVRVHRTWTLDLPFALRKAVKRLAGGRATSNPALAAQQVYSGNVLKRMLGNLLLPDPQVGWLPFVFPAARRIIRRHAIDVVLITVPPFSAARLVTLLRRGSPQLPIVLDFRDEWLSTSINLVSFNSNERARIVAARTEAAAVRDATAVVAVTEAARRELIMRNPGRESTKFHYLPNGFETREPVRSPSLNGIDEFQRRVTMTYIGSVYGSTDPSSFVDAVLALPPDLRARLHVRFIGRIETEVLKASLMRLGANLQLRGFVPQAEALRAIDDTDYLLLLTHDRINVSAKFYDYLASGKPIVAAVHPEGDVRRLLEKTGTGVWAPIGSPTAIRDLLAGVLSGTTVFPLPDPERIAAFHRQPIAKRYAQLLHWLAQRSH